MGGGVSLRMPVMAGKRYEPVQGRKDILRNIRIGVLVDRDRCCGMGDKEMADPVFDPAFPDILRDATRDVDHLTSGGGGDCK